MSLIFQEEEIELVWKPEDYMYYNEISDDYCIGIKPLEKNVLGGTFMKNKDIYFDSREDRQKIGIIEAECVTLN